MTNGGGPVNQILSEARRNKVPPIIIRPFGEADGAGLGSEDSTFQIMGVQVTVYHAVWYPALWNFAVLDVLPKLSQIHTMRNGASAILMTSAILMRADGSVGEEIDSVLSCTQSPIQFVRGCRRH